MKTQLTQEQVAYAKEMLWDKCMQEAKEMGYDGWQQEEKAQDIFSYLLINIENNLKKK